MELVISQLIDRFERGALTRRELVQGLAMLSAGGALCEAQPRPAATQGARIDHVSIQVRDLPRSVGFYQEMFGFSVVSEDKPNEIVRLGVEKSVLVSLHHKNPTGLVDHFAIGVRNFNKDTVARTLKEHGAEPSDNLDAGFHIVDPEGINVQIMGA
ncbi:MAG TPA: VOC family protein [Bryobacteraceae bacterium]|jgi:catechol 2,3-dioxygenase-like lactoylglutathione lyase family enzyme|nr:VOC family protein [Bryobacteraceae bacterium]